MDAIDWRAFLPDTVDVDETLDGRLVVVFGDRSRCTWLRHADATAAAWLLGYYQADGGKTALQFTVSSVEPRLLARVADTLRDVFGVAPVDMTLAAPPERLAEFERVGVPVRPREGRNTGELAVRDSRWLNAAIAQLLERWVDQRLLLTCRPATQRAFVLGFLDGDGSVTVTANETSLRLTGLHQEVAVVDAALLASFGWAAKGKWIDKKTYVETRRTLTATEIGDLLVAGAFPYSMNRGRLLRTWNRRLEKFRAFVRGHRGGLPYSLWQRWGLYADGALTPAAQALLTRDEQLAVEQKAFAAVDHDMIIGQKGAPYPLAPLVWPRPPAVCYQRSLRDRLRLFVPRPELAPITLASTRIRAVEKHEAKALIEQYEWLGDIGAAQIFYGLQLGAELLGVVGFGQSSGPKAHEICDDVPRDQTIGLLRGACVHWAPRNAASYLIRRACAAAHRDHGWRVFFAYADEEAGEIGQIYQASNWFYLGKALGLTTPMRPRYVDRNRVYAGRYKTSGEYYYPAVAKHKYVWFEGSDWQRRGLRRTCRYPFQPYPKRSGG